MDDMVERVIASRQRLVVFEGIERHQRRGWYVSLPMETENEDREVLAGPFASSAEADHEADRINARAAIEAMREPTEAMMEAGDNCEVTRSFDMSTPIYQAMIDAALASPDDKDAA